MFLRIQSFVRRPSGIRRRVVSVLLQLAALLAIAAAVPGAVNAEPIGEIQLPSGFRAELVYAVPLERQGSWVALTVDDRGRLIASDQNGALYRVEPSPLGAPPSQTRVEPIPMTIGMAQGLQVVDGKLYVVMNGQLGAFATGLYRLSDDNGDDRYDNFEQLRVFQGSGEHGPHAVVLGPDRKSLYIVCGNMTGLPLYTRSLVPPRWGEDQPLPRISDPMGAASNLSAPGGWIARTDLDGKNLEIVSVGYRNAYDLAFNADGELFTFDSDMEWDIGTPWYRPTRVCHVTSGSDFGWRGGNGPWPPYYPDTLPPVVDVGPGSPTGLAFGTGTKFPPRYQHALFAGDWSYGNIYAIHLTAEGATYRGEVERFASAMPLAVTDLVVRPQDGALYFTVGGRQSESALYRIVAGDAAAAATTQPEATQTVVETRGAALPSPEEARRIRRTLEALHSGPHAGAIERAWPYLSHADRFIRYAARVAVEQQPPAEWRERALAEPDPQARIQALIALAPCGEPSDQPAWVASLTELKFADMTRDQRLDFVRAATLGVIRLGMPESAARQKLLDAFDSHFPTGDHLVDRDLGSLLVLMSAPGMVDRLLAWLDAAVTPEEAIDAAVILSTTPGTWTVAQRTRLLDWFDAAAHRSGGVSFFGYIVSARNRFIAAMPAADRQALGERISRPLVQDPSPAASAEARPFVREWKLDDLLPLAESDRGPRDLANGRRMFAAARCYDCHRVAGEGSSVGPDLTGVGRRFNVRDILRAIVDPDQQISDQYQQMVFKANGRTIVGRITNLSQDQVMVATNMLDPKSETKIRRDEIDKQYPSPVSTMPAGLLNTLSEEEVLDLLAYLRSGGAASATPQTGSIAPGTPAR